LDSFTPRRLKYWFQDHSIQFRKEHPEIKWFKLHSVCATAISQVRQAGVSSERAAFFFGVDPVTLARPYEALDETAIADESRRSVRRAVKSVEKWWRRVEKGHGLGQEVQKDALFSCGIISLRNSWRSPFSARV
jgi:hypothetical protein